MLDSLSPLKQSFCKAVLKEMCLSKNVLNLTDNWFAKKKQTHKSLRRKEPIKENNILRLEIVFPGKLLKETLLVFRKIQVFKIVKKSGESSESNWN